MLHRQSWVRQNFGEDDGWNCDVAGRERSIELIHVDTGSALYEGNQGG